MAGQHQRFCPPEKGRVLFVEGFDDLRVVQQICRIEEFDNVQLIAYAELGTLGDYLDLFVKHEKFQGVERIGLTKDADTNFASAQQSLVSSWQRAAQTLVGLNMPVPQHSTFVLPNNAGSGKMEDICIASASSQEILQCSQALLTCATPHVTYPIDEQKAIVAGYLSMMRKAGLNLGAAAEMGSWNLNSPAFAPLRVFIRSICT
jgi:uncharacterized protein DUF3226